MPRNPYVALVLAAALALFPIAPSPQSIALAFAATSTNAPAAVEVLTDPQVVANWTHENHGGAVSSFTSDGRVLRLVVTSPGTERWHVQIYQPGKVLVPDATYTVKFEVRSNARHELAVAAMKDGPDYGSLGLYEAAESGTAWRAFEFSFRAPSGDTARLPCLQVGGTAGTLEFRNLSVLGPAPVPSPAAKLPDHYFPFVIPWDDAVKNVATDLSALNHVGKPLPRIEVRGGHFYEAGTDTRVRFWATNFGADEAFPDKASADAVAARLAKYGINLVRLHHLDNPWAIGSRGSIWDPDQQKRVIDPVQLDKLHYLMAALARNGIYVNLNLKVSKTLSAADGAPEGTEQLASGFSTSFQKKVDRFYRFFIDQQKAYAKQLLTTPNPYRDNLTPASDPSIAFVELNNENAAAGWPGEAPGAGLTELPPVFRNDLREKWNRFLRDKYTDQARLLAAWKNDTDRPGENILAANPVFTANRPGDSEVTATAPTPPEGTIRFDVSRTSGTEWHAQGILELPALQSDRNYTLEFQARATPARAMRVSVDRNGAPWDNQGLNATVSLSDQWSTHRLVFRSGDAPNQRVALQLGSRTGAVEIRAVRMFPGVSGEPVAAGESLDNASLSLPRSDALPAVQKDWRLFVTDLDRRFANEMLDYLKNDLQVKGLIADTQIQWGSLGGIAREEQMHWTDSHAYWNHPNFPAGDWNPRSWTVDQTSLTEAFGRGDFGTLGGLAIHRVAGKPFSVSEYDHPAPNDFVSEMVPMVAAWGDLQDWDKIYTFAYAGYRNGANTDRIQGFFDQGSHPAKWAFNPSAALIFRQGLIPPLASVTTLSIPRDAHGQIWSVETAWRSGGGIPDLMTHRTAIAQAKSDSPFQVETKSPKPEANAAVSAGMVKGPNGNVLVVRSDKAIVVTGFVGGATLDLPPFQLQVPGFGNQFASLTIVPLDQKPLATSDRMLLTFIGRAENPGMGWNAARTSVSDQWGTGPVHLEGVTATLRPTGARKFSAYPLNPTGTRMEVVAPAGDGAIPLRSRSPWYELVPTP